MKVVLVMFKKNERREFPLEADKAILGRRQDCQLRIPTKDVSRQHCALLVDDDVLIVKDLGSSNGTYVNDKRIAETELEPGDRLRVGPVTFVVQIDGEPREIRPSDAAPMAAAAAAMASDKEDGKTFDLSEDDFELGEDDFDIDEAITEMEEITDDEEDDMP